mgnify:CR=1 FL=1
MRVCVGEHVRAWTMTAYVCYTRLVVVSILDIETCHQVGYKHHITVMGPVYLSSMCVARPGSRTIGRGTTHNLRTQGALQVPISHTLPIFEPEFEILDV